MFYCCVCVVLVALLLVAVDWTEGVSYASSSSLAPTEWVEFASPDAQLGLASAMLLDGDKTMLLIGRGPETWELNLQENKWTSNRSQREHIDGGHAGVIHHGQVYLFSGFSRSIGKVQTYNPVLDVWSTLPQPMLWVVEFGMFAVSLGRNVYVCGGYSGGSILGFCGVFDTEEQEWTSSLPIMLLPVKFAGGATDGKNIFAFGGTMDNGEPVAQVQQFNFNKGNWAFIARLPSPTSGVAAIFLNGDFYIIGGERKKGTDQVNILTPNGVWKKGPTLLQRRSHGAVCATNDTIILAAGYKKKGEKRMHDSVESLSFVASHGDFDSTSNQSSSSNRKRATKKTTTTVPPKTKKTKKNKTKKSSTTIISTTTTTSTALTKAEKTKKAKLTTTEATTTTKSTRTKKSNSSPAEESTEQASYSTTTSQSTKKPTTANHDISRGFWEDGHIIPTAIYEVTAAFIKNFIYVMGGGDSRTYAYNILSQAWLSTKLAERPYPGDHHAAVVYMDNLYLVGGLSKSGGQLQKYDVANNRWSVLSSFSFSSGSINAVAIGNYIYACGGINNAKTVSDCAIYDFKKDLWDQNSMAPMPYGVNHAAFGTDGKYLWIFGGRGGSNVPSNGYNYVQRYDPAKNSWLTSEESQATLAPLPVGRGGTGCAVYLNGLFFVIGGETLNGEDATSSGVYNRVDIYDPATNTWDEGERMPTARHGSYPVAADGQIHVIGGGIRRALSSTNIHEIYNP